MGYPIEINGSISLAIDAKSTLSTIGTRKGSNARINETFFREELRDSGLATLKARLGLSIARARLLAFVSASGGLAQS
jgi:hypothetical protein